MLEKVLLSKEMHWKNVLSKKPFCHKNCCCWHSRLSKAHLANCMRVEEGRGKIIIKNRSSWTASNASEEKSPSKCHHFSLELVCYWWIHRDSVCLLWCCWLLKKKRESLLEFRKCLIALSLALSVIAYDACLSGEKNAQGDEAWWLIKIRRNIELFWGDVISWLARLNFGNKRKVYCRCNSKCSKQRCKIH